MPIPAHVPLRPLVVSDFFTEITMVCFLGFFVAVYWFGAKANRAVASSWAETHNKYFLGQFSLVGDRADSARTTIFKDGPADYFLYTSGRVYVQFAHWCLKLKPRNDPISLLTSTVFSMVGMADSVKDRADITVTMDSNTKNRFVFAIMDKSIAQDKHDKRYDLSKLTKLASTKLPSNLVVYTEAQKVAELLLAGQVGDILRDASGLEQVIITYLPDYEPARLKLDNDLTINVIYTIEDAKSTRLVELPMALADAIGSMNMPADVRTKLQKNSEGLRKEFAKREAEDRAEELAKKKADAKRAESERVQKMSASEQRKYDEKERIREKKKELKKRTKRA
ncbi:hypothetical protein BC940DRAFT_29479 [Gongronella butleri]|nr:hypothetical protein BC940DRAFT_29479 [Gongronella butleri]